MKENNNSSTNKEMDVIINIVDEKFKKIMAIEYHYNLFELFKVLDEKTEQEQNKIYENLINYYLNLIKENGSYQIIFDKEREIDDILSFFDYTYFIKNEEKVKTCWNTQEEGDYVANDLVEKIFGRNKRNIKLPVSLQTIKDYSVPNIVPKSEMKYIVLYIILRLATIYYISVSEN